MQNNSCYRDNFMCIDTIDRRDVMHSYSSDEKRGTDNTFN